MSSSQLPVTFIFDNEIVHLNYEFQIKNSNFNNRRPISGGQLQIPFKASKVKGRDYSLGENLNLWFTTDNRYTIIVFSLKTLIIHGEQRNIKIILSAFKDESMNRLGSIHQMDWDLKIKKIYLRRNTLFMLSYPFERRREGKFDSLTIRKFSSNLLTFNNRKKPLRIELGKQINYSLGFSLDFIIKGSPVYNLGINFLGIKKTHYQAVETIFISKNAEEKVDNQGNTHILWEFRKLDPGKYRLKIKYHIIRIPEYIDTIELGTKDDYEIINAKFLMNTEIWDSNEEMKNIISRISERTKNIYKIYIASLNTINKRVNYHPTKGRGTASKTWNKRQGDCIEYSDLLVSMLRQAGIPSRIVVGYIANKNGFTREKHTWVEFFSPLVGWKSVDNTWGHINGISGQHIAHHTDNGSHTEKIVKFDYDYQESASPQILYKINKFINIL